MDKTPVRDDHVHLSQCFLFGDVTIPSDSISYNFGNQEIVYSQNILDGEIATVDLANDAVTTAKIANDAVTTAKIADDAVTNDKIFTLDASKLTGTINNGRIGGLTNLDIAGNAAIAGTKIDTLPASKLTGTINNDRISGLTTDDLAPEAEISSDQILELDADKLTGTISNLRISGLTTTICPPLQALPTKRFHLLMLLDSRLEQCRPHGYLR